MTIISLSLKKQSFYRHFQRSENADSTPSIMHPSCSMAERIDVSTSKGRWIQASYHIPSNKEIQINPHLAALLRVTPGETLSFHVSEQGRVTLTGRKDLLQL